MSSPQAYPSSSSGFRRSSPAANFNPPAAQPSRLDALNLDDDLEEQDQDGLDGEDPQAASRRSARRRLRGNGVEAIPRFKDATGEAVCQSFQDFLEQ